MTQSDTLHAWERWPVAGLLAAAGLNTAVWYVGAQLGGAADFWPDLMVTIGAVASVVAIDGALIATVAGMREGRRSRWSAGNIGVTALFTGLAALSAHGVWRDDWRIIGSLLHGLFALTIVTYAMHLAQPKVTPVNPHVDSLQAQLTQALAELDALRTPTLTVVDAPAARLPAPVDARPDIVRWRDDDGLTFDAIGERLSITRQAAQARYRRAKGE